MTTSTSQGRSVPFFFGLFVFLFFICLSLLNELMFFRLLTSTFCVLSSSYAAALSRAASWARLIRPASKLVL